MGTAHNRANMGDIAKTVLMPGDPLRAKYIAETFLEDAKLVTDVRNIYAYTGTYHGHRVTVMASGMGMPSIGIYSYELYSFYGVENIIRIGSTGSYNPDLKLYDVVMAESAYSTSNFAEVLNGYKEDTLYPSKAINETIMAASRETGIAVTPCKVYSSDIFYGGPASKPWPEIRAEHGVDVVEMESFSLFANARMLSKNAACLLTVSDSMVTGEVTTPEERQQAFVNMMKVALETAVRLDA